MNLTWIGYFNRPGPELTHYNIDFSLELTFLKLHCSTANPKPKSAGRMPEKFNLHSCSIPTLLLASPKSLKIAKLVTSCMPGVWVIRAAGEVPSFALLPYMHTPC